MADFNLQIVTAQQTVFDEDVTALTLPGADGSFGVLANHAPIVAVLRDGQMTIRRGQREEYVRIGGGFLEMSSNRATVLVDSIQGLERITTKPRPAI
jgi:F-type H+-transporting ATPase subunit epsilon